MPTVCTIVRSNRANMTDFKANAGVRNTSTTSVVGSSKTSRSKPGARLMPSFSPSGEIGEQLTTWLTGSGGGYKKNRPAQQIVSRCLKFLKFCSEEEEELSFDVVDFSLCSPSLLFKFIDCFQEECKLGHGGRLGYFGFCQMKNLRQRIPVFFQNLFKRVVLSQSHVPYMNTPFLLLLKILHLLQYQFLDAFVQLHVEVAE